jgi:hypothetical protein
MRVKKLESRDCKISWMKSTKENMNKKYKGKKKAGTDSLKQKKINGGKNRCRGISQRVIN